MSDALIGNQFAPGGSTWEQVISDGHSGERFALTLQRIPASTPLLSLSPQEQITASVRPSASTPQLLQR